MVEQHAKERMTNAFLHKDCAGDDSCENGESPEGSSVNGDVQSWRQRPVSVIGGVDLLSPNAEEKDDHLPSVSLHTHCLVFFWGGGVCMSSFPCIALFVPHL